MKLKVVVLAIAAVCSAFAQNAKTAQDILAGFPSEADTKTRNEWQYTLNVDEIKAVADYALEVSKTNLFAGKDIASRVYYSMFQHRGPVAPGLELAPEYDAKFADAGIVFGANMFKNAPKCTEKFIVTHREGVILKEFPAFVQYTRKAIENNDDSVDVCALINCIAECGTKSNVYFGYGSVDHPISLVLRKAPRYIRYKLRKHGMPIVVKDGKNYVQDAVDELSAALNAPRMAGLKEWAGKWVPDYKWIDVKWMSDEEFEKFKDAIFYGDIRFDRMNMFILRFHLGVDAYNDFVKKYNN
jgi:hypothetical protein